MRRGFTLLEVMVALAILAMGLVGVSDLVGGAKRNHARAKGLENATLLARGKMAGVEERYQEEGFRDFDEADEGNFDDEGHPEVAWALEVVKPTVDLGGTAACAAFLGGGDLGELLGGAAPSSEGGPTEGPSPLAAAMEGFVKQQCTLFGETLKKSLREARLKVSWPASGAGMLPLSLGHWSTICLQNTGHSHNSPACNAPVGAGIIGPSACERTFTCLAWSNVLHLSGAIWMVGSVSSLPIGLFEVRQPPRDEISLRLLLHLAVGPPGVGPRGQVGRLADEFVQVGHRYFRLRRLRRPLRQGQAQGDEHGD